MKVLLSAIACDPWAGSENYFGWAAVQCLAQDHDLWVLTSKRNRDNLEKAQTAGLVPPNVHFIYSGRFKEWHPNRMRARLQSWKEYMIFSRTILGTARELHRTVNFDLAHHVTFATWRVASPLWKLGIPFILGPIGGYERFPFQYVPILSPSAIRFELFREFANRLSRFSASIRACICHSASIFVANAETESLIKRIRRSDAGISRLMAAFYSSTKIKAFAGGGAKEMNGPLNLFAGGNLEGRKGVALALHALAQAKAVGVQFRYRLGGQGPESRHLRDLATRLSLQNDIIFGEPLSGEAYRRELDDTHIYLLPSLRDSAPLTLMEAMLAGCVPIVADCGGPAHIVTEGCGYKIPISSRQRTVNDLTSTILTIDRNREIILKKGAAAATRIATDFTAENYRKVVNSAYLSVTQACRKQKGAAC